MAEYTFSLTIGDWSGDGHGFSRDYIYKSNYPIEEILKAYKKTCDQLGYKLDNNHKNDGNIVFANNYEESHMPDELKEKLLSLGLDGVGDNDFDENSEFYDNGDLTQDDMAELFTWFVKHNMPDDFVCEELKFESVNAWRGLNSFIGYGTFQN